MIINKTIYFDIIVGEYNNFLQYSDLLNCQIVETAGIALPYASITFRTPDVNIKNKIIENNPITIKLGESQTNAEIFDISLAEKKILTDSSEQYFIIHFVGFLQDKSFLIDRKIECYTGNSLNVLQQLTSEYFTNTLDTSVTSVIDVPGKWRQCNETAQMFMSEVWLHMNIKPSVPLVAITKSGNVLLRDLETIKKSTPKWVFTPNEVVETNEIRYYNKFKPKSHKFTSNLYAGYGRVISIPTTETGEYDVVISDNEPELSASQTAEQAYNTGTTIFEGFYNNGNVHHTWHQSYFYNSAKLVKMSSIIGTAELLGYYKNLNLLDLVRIKTADNRDTSIEGKYIIDTISITFGYNDVIKTEVYLARDNSNNIEDNVAKKAPKLNFTNAQKAELLTSVRNLRRLVSMGRQGMDGDLLTRITTYSTSLKYNVFSSFTLAGVALNLNSAVEAVDSLKHIGNSIINKIIDLYIPAPFNSVLQNFALNNYSLLSYFTKLISQFVIVEELAGLISDITSLVAKSTDTLSSISKSNSTYTYTELATSSETSQISYTDSVDGITSVSIGEKMTSNTETTIANILDDFQNNTNGVDIPLAVPDLTDSELLQNADNLKNTLAENVITDLSAKGYLDGLSTSTFKEILLGNSPLDYATIEIINSNVGNILSIRHWGCFSDLIELTDFYIRKSYKDKYKTVPVTKIVNAKGGKYLFFALPTSVTGLKFYVNSTLKTFDSFEILLGYKDVYGKDIPYTVYYDAGEKYASNSVTLEVLVSA